MQKMTDVYVLVADGKINKTLYSSKDEAEVAIYQICSSIESWYRDYPVKIENIRAITLYEYIESLRKAE